MKRRHLRAPSSRSGRLTLRLLRRASRCRARPTRLLATVTAAFVVVIVVVVVVVVVVVAAVREPES
jgi:uncharacterized protein (DUF983 family)